MIKKTIKTGGEGLYEQIKLYDIQVYCKRDDITVDLETFHLILLLVNKCMSIVFAKLAMVFMCSEAFCRSTWRPLQGFSEVLDQDF